MDEKNSKKLIVESLNSLPLISIMEYSNEPWVIRDCESRYVYVNQAGKSVAEPPISNTAKANAIGAMPLPNTVRSRAKNKFLNGA